MSLAPYSCRCDAQDATHCNTTQMICCEQRCVLESYAENDREGDRVGGEKRRGDRRNNTDYAEDTNYQVALPQRPILLLVSIKLL
jgi:hypothetical protein